MQDKLTIQLYRGYTHGEFIVPQLSPVGFVVGDLVKSMLSEREFDPRWKRYFIARKYATYEANRQALKVPISFVDDFIDALKVQNCEVVEKKINDYALRKINVQMNPMFTDRPWQVNLIKECSKKTPGIKGLALQTGKGKTYSATKSMINLGYAGVILTAGLTDQWIRSIKEQTDVGDDIYLIEGFKSIANLVCSDYKPSIIVASLRTMQLYLKGQGDYAELPLNFKQFFIHYGIGVKIVDECHLNFHANTMMDLELNVPYNLYLSATFTQSNNDARRIFNKIFPEDIQYGINDYDKYVITYFHNFRGEVMEKKCVKLRGYSHSKYEAELMKNHLKLERHLEHMFYPIIDQYYINRYSRGLKMLIFCNTIDYIMHVKKLLQEHYPDKTVIEYIGGSDDNNLVEGDIILTNPSKSGTGLDVKGLITVYNTVSMKSPALSPQLFGRLRKIDDKDVVYVDTCDLNLNSQIRHADVRKKMLRRLSAKFFEFIENGFTL